jgi:hypothetical protein
MDHNKAPTDAAQSQFEQELHAMVEQHRNAPSIIMWVVFNEGWGQYDHARGADMMMQGDTSRVVDNMSGVNCCGAVDGGNGDVVDYHAYVGPESPYPSQKRAAVLGEFGGLGLRVAGHEWQPGKGFSYENQKDAAALTKRYVGLIKAVEFLMKNSGLSAAVYTEITDVENEVNGIMTYDRAVVKPDAAQINAAHQRLIEESKQLNR